MLLTQPLTINNLTLRNRIVMPPMATGKAVNGAPPEELADYYAARAGATGLIIVEHEYVSLEGRASLNQLSIADDSVIPGYRRLTDAVHAKGAKIMAQLSHAGGAARDAELPPIAPSPVTARPDRPIPKEMDEDDIAHVTASFVSAALRAKAAGFDGVEIHAAHGYLLNQFYSPVTNKRTDGYTGSTLQGRTRLHCEVLYAVRDAVGPDFIIAIRFGACDYREGGSVIEEIPAAAAAFRNAGADIIDISGGLNGFMIKDRSGAGYFAECSIAAKNAVDIPVILTGGVTTGEEAEALLAEGAADLIGVGRAMLEDAQWSEHALGL